MTQTVMQEGKLDTLGARIKHARKAKRMTMRSLAEELGVTERTVAGYEAKKPRSRPSYERLAKIAEVLERPPSWFLGEDREAAA